MEYERVIITGASSGLGETFAEALAQEGAELVLIARRQERLEQLAARLSGRHSGLAARVLCCDLADPAARERLVAKLSALPPKRSLLINNAGLGDYGEVLSAEGPKINRLMQVNMLALVELTHALLPGLVQHGGAIINISSLAADLFIPDFALYAASKAFVASFSEALRLELRAHGVRVLAVCPGPVHTEFGSVAQRPGHDKGDIPLKPLLYTTRERVVRGSLRALAAGRARHYPGLKILLAGCVLRALPLWLMRRVLSLRPRRVKPQQGGGGV